MRVWWSIVLLVCMPLWARAEAGDASAQRGQQIYLQGTSARGADIVAIMGTGGVEVPAATLPCVNCDGRGRPEGGVTPSNITWTALTKPYGGRHPSGRTHPPYTERHLVRAITMGIDAGGQTLHDIMPRYQLSREDAADLVAYLKVLDTVRDPGLTDEAIHIGVMLPPTERYGDMQNAVRGLLTAYATTRNDAGGVYGRRLALQFVEAPAAPEERPEALRGFLTSQPSFVLTSVFMAGAERGIADFTTEPQLDIPPNRYVFYLYSGLSGQAQALALFACNQEAEAKRRAAVVYPDVPSRRHVAEALRKRGLEAPWEAIDAVPIPRNGMKVPELVQDLKQRGTQAIFWLAAGEDARTVLREAAEQDWQPQLFIPGALAGGELFNVPARFDRQIFVAFPTSPADHSPAGIEVYREVARAHPLPSSYMSAQLKALAAMQVLVEALTRAGRDLSRQKVIKALESLYDFRTGLTPAITYTTNRRIGAAGAYIVALDVPKQRFVAVSRCLKLQ